MPTMANLALKNNAAAAVVGTALSPSAGDNVAAQWRIETAKPPFARAKLWLSARFNQKQDARRVSLKVEVPYTVTNSTTSLEEAVSKILFTGELVVGTNVPTSVSDDAVAYISSFIADPGVIAALKAQIAPN